MSRRRLTLHLPVFMNDHVPNEKAALALIREAMVARGLPVPDAQGRMPKTPLPPEPVWDPAKQTYAEFRAGKPIVEKVPTGIAAWVKDAPLHPIYLEPPDRSLVPTLSIESQPFGDLGTQTPPAEPSLREALQEIADNMRSGAEPTPQNVGWLPNPATQPWFNPNSGEVPVRLSGFDENLLSVPRVPLPDGPITPNTIVRGERCDREHRAGFGESAGCSCCPRDDAEQEALNNTAAIAATAPEQDADVPLPIADEAESCDPWDAQ